MEARKEYRLGEVFEENGVKLKCVEGHVGCLGCCLVDCDSVHCLASRRTDGKGVVFIKAEEETKQTLKNSHYVGSGIDVIDLMKVSGDIKGFLAGNVLKYVARRNNKGQHEDDIVKAIDYMIMLALEEGMEADKITEILEKRKMRK